MRTLFTRKYLNFPYSSKQFVAKRILKKNGSGLCAVLMMYSFLALIVDFNTLSHIYIYRRFARIMFVDEC